MVRGAIRDAKAFVATKDSRGSGLVGLMIGTFLACAIGIGAIVMSRDVPTSPSMSAARPSPPAIGNPNINDPGVQACMRSLQICNPPANSAAQALSPPMQAPSAHPTYKDRTWVESDAKVDTIFRGGGLSGSAIPPAPDSSIVYSAMMTRNHLNGMPGVEKDLGMNLNRQVWVVTVRPPGQASYTAVYDAETGIVTDAFSLALLSKST